MSTPPQHTASNDAAGPAEPAEMARARRADLGRWLAVGAFPVLVWFCASYFYLGEIGKYSDDWAINYRDPGSPAFALDGHPFERWNYFWRPLHLILTCGSQTLFWEQGWLLHGLNALAHGAVAWLLWRLLREIGVRERIAAAGTLAALVHPVVYEAVGWTSTVSTLIATAMLLVLWRRTVALATGVRRWEGSGLRSLWWFGPWTFAMACFYEQQAGVACLASLLFWTMGERDADRPTRRERLRRAVLIGIGPAAACAVYVALMVSTAPNHLRGGRGSFRDLSVVREQWQNAIDQVGDWLIGEKVRAFAAGGLEQGWSAIGASGAWGWLVMALLAVAAVAWLVVWWWRRSEEVGGIARSKTPSGGEAETRTAKGGRWGLIATGLVLLAIVGIALAVLPSAVATGVPPQARLIYLPLVLSLVAAAGAAECAVRAAPRRVVGWSARIGGPVLAALVCIGCVVQIGSQDAFRRRWLADADMMSQLRALLPDPPGGTNFVPLALRHRPVRTASDRFNTALPGAAQLPWAAWAWVQDGYGRRDLLATHLRPALARVITNIDETGFRYVSRWGGARGRVSGGGWSVRWDQSVPFVVEEDGTVRLVRRVGLGGPDDSAKWVPIPIVEGAIESGALPLERTAEHRLR